MSQDTLKSFVKATVSRSQFITATSITRDVTDETDIRENWLHTYQHTNCSGVLDLAAKLIGAIQIFLSLHIGNYIST